MKIFRKILFALSQAFGWERVNPIYLQCQGSLQWVTTVEDWEPEVTVWEERFKILWITFYRRFAGKLRAEIAPMQMKRVVRYFSSLKRCKDKMMALVRDGINSSTFENIKRL